MPAAIALLLGPLLTVALALLIAPILLDYLLDTRNKK